MAVDVVVLVVGWLAVSRLFAISPPALEKLPDGGWFEVLGVPRDARPEQIDAAWESKRSVLAERELRIMTATEQEQATELRTRLDAARNRGQAQSAGSG